MKQYSVLFSALILILSANTAYAGPDYCIKRLVNLASPKDLLTQALICVPDRVETGHNSFILGCFGVFKTAGSNFESTEFRTLQFNENEHTGYRTVVAIDKTGSPIGNAKITQKESTLVLASYLSTPDGGHRWIEETTLDASNPKSFKFRIIERKLTADRVTRSVTYRCKIAD